MKKETPLLTQILEHLKQDITGFHTPGHQQGRGCLEDFQKMMEEHFLKMDLTEIPGLDNLRAAKGCLAETQNLAAKLFGAKETLFLVNGSTVGIQAALLAINKPGEKIIIARNAHISAVNGLVLSGGIPVLAPVEMDEHWHFPLGISLHKLKNIINKNRNTKGILFANPEYRGTGMDISQAIELIKKFNIPAIIDEAHGAHLYFQRDIPLSAQQHSPDIVIHSTHKTLAALTQASMLHINNKKWGPAIRSALNILQTTSPSYLLLASLDGVQKQMRTKGYDLISRTLEIAQYFRIKAEQLDGYRIYEADLDKGWYQDKTKLMISAADLGLTGWELASLLQREYGVAVEMSDYYYVLFLLNLGHDYADINKVINALKAIRKYKKNNKLHPINNGAFILKQNYQPTISPRDVFYSSKEMIKLKQAKGRIVGDALVIYPPGIPLVWPGEILRQEHIDFFAEIKKQQIILQGISADGMVSVLTEV